MALTFLCLGLLFCLGSKTAYASAGTIYESEPNNTYSAADLTYDDYDNYGYISTTSDVDWWKVKFNSSGTANFWLGNVPSGCDYDLRLYSSNGTTLIQSSTNSGNANELITINVSANVYYYIKINSYSGSSSSSRYLFRAKLYPDPPIITKSDLRSETIYFGFPLSGNGGGAIISVGTNVAYNLYVSHQKVGTNRKIISVSHYVEASQIDPAFGSIEVTAAWTGIDYVYNGVTTKHWAHFDGNIFYPQNGYVWDHKVDNQGYTYPWTDMIDVKTNVHFYCTDSVPGFINRSNALIIP